MVNTFQWSLQQPCDLIVWAIFFLWWPKEITRTQDEVKFSVLCIDSLYFCENILYWAGCRANGQTKDQSGSQYACIRLDRIGRNHTSWQKTLEQFIWMMMIGICRSTSSGHNRHRGPLMSSYNIAIFKLWLRTSLTSRRDRGNYVNVYGRPG